MKRHIILFIISFLLVGGGLCTFTYFNIKKQETSTKINDYGLLNHYFKNKEIPNDCNLFVYSGETYKIQGITLKLLSYIFDGHQAKCVFSVFGENKKDVEEFGIDTGGEEEIRNCNLLSPRELGRAYLPSVSLDSSGICTDPTILNLSNILALSSRMRGRILSFVVDNL